MFLYSRVFHLSYSETYFRFCPLWLCQNRPGLCPYWIKDNGMWPNQSDSFTWTLKAKKTERGWGENLGGFFFPVTDTIHGFLTESRNSDIYWERQTRSGSGESFWIRVNSGSLHYRCQRNEWQGHHSGRTVTLPLRLLLRVFPPRYFKVKT